MEEKKMADLTKIVGVTISIGVSVIILGNVLVPIVNDLTGTDGALTEYAGLLSAIIVIVITAILMIGVRAISSRW